MDKKTPDLTRAGASLSLKLSSFPPAAPKDNSRNGLTAIPKGPLPTSAETAHRRVLFYTGASTPSKLIEETLKSRGMRVIAVQDLDELREEWHAGTCDIVILDHSLSIAQKLSLLETAGDHKHPFPVIMLFEPGADEEARKAKSSGAAECVVRDEFGEYLIKIPALIEVFSRESPLKITNDLHPDRLSTDDEDETENTMRINLTELAAEVRGTALETQQASLIVLSGPDVGKTVQLDAVLCMVGRDPSCQLNLCDESVSRYHAGFKQYPNGVVILKDLDSTNGTFINGKRIRAIELKEGDKILVGKNTLIGFQLNDAIEKQYYEELYQSSTRDGLTGIYNRRHCLERIRTGLAYAKRHRLPISILLFDVDHFKAINDTYGHQTGDTVLRSIATITGQSVREEDILGRYGGEEFLIFTLNTDLNGARILAERIRRKIEKHEMYTEEITPRTVHTSVSIGISTADKTTTYNLDQLIHAADINLYKAKANGRNCTVSSVIPLENFN